MKELEISLFPIPGSVSLPFTAVPLHVFEPRYRKMIKDSVAMKRRIGVAHTKRVVSRAKSQAEATQEERLNQNQDTYETYPVFSAGFAEILETLPDGRMVVEIAMDSRYEIIEELQQLPYKVVRCREFEDDAAFEPGAEKLREELDQFLLRIAGVQVPALKDYLLSPKWKSLNNLQYSFAVYTFVMFEPDVLQKVLELKSSLERISFLKDTLDKSTLQ
ncbi:MAG: LON peptidase substrate-binding domain-containing protein [Methylotenera sp.]|nr:LON peptidase substrate-binding domain-containing protein [Oligoflexia bacterium]